jgi:hypothetical protein
MRHISPLLLISLILLAPPAAAQRAKRPTERTDRIERHGITWHFAERHLTGAFANGDPWVNGPVRIRRITPAAVNLDGRHVHGAMIDPDPTSLRQGYDSLLYGKWSDGTYHESLDVGRLLAAGDEVRLLPGQSLVSVVSKTTADDRVPQLLVAAVLTCVDQRPADDAFRPPYCKAPERDKQVQFRRRDLDLDSLGRLEKVVGMPDPDEVADRFERLWLDHFPSWVGRLAHPIEAMPDYGRDLAAWTGSAALLLNTKGNQKALEPLLIRFVQLGIDCHGLIRGGCRFVGNGGHGSGRKFPILFAGALLRDERMLATGKDFPSRHEPQGKSTAFFGEDCQTFFVEETAPGTFNYGHGGYGKEHLGMPEWGFSHSLDPSRDALEWDKDNYRRCCTANAWLGYALAARAMGLVETWNHPAFFAYVDRYLQQEQRQAWRAWSGWHDAMWQRNRSEY